jgi:hypothetical protein
MPDAAADAKSETARSRVSDLNVSGHLMTLEPGLFCIVQLPSKRADIRTGLPGVRVSLPPGTASRPEAVTIGGFGNDGWLNAFGDAALVRVRDQPAQVLVTIYQSSTGDDTAPSLQVMRLLDPDAPAGQPAIASPATTPLVVPVAKRAPAATPETPKLQDMVAHIQTRGDVGAMIGDWLGERGSKRWIEGFAVAPTAGVAPSDLEYQAVLGRGWLSPWAEGGQYCGSRGMALPVLGLRVRLRGDADRDYECLCAASFVDGTQIGPVPAGHACESESLAPLEAFQIILRRRGTATPPEPAAPVLAVAPVAKVPVTKPAGANAAKVVAAAPESPKPAPNIVAPAKAAKPAPRKR